MSSASFEVRDLRRAISANGYHPIRVRTGGKQPVARNWQHKEDIQDLLAVTPDASNTGILCSGLRVIDIDIDDGNIVDAVLGSAEVMFPGHPLVRGRPDSVRVALVYRAASGEPPKRAINGSNGKVEVLGAGQQLLAFGTHPSGAILYWEGERSPATIPIGDLPVVSEDDVELFLAICVPLLGDPITAVGNGRDDGAANRPTFPFTCEVNFPPRDDAGGSAREAAEELGGGIDDGRWFSKLPPHAQEQLVRACLKAIDKAKHDPRHDWLVILFAVADAGRQGCPNARGLALEWSMRGAGWTSESDFDIAWDSAK